MIRLTCIYFLLALGCGAPSPAPPVAAPLAEEAFPGPAGKPGSDWTGFLGPTGDSVSSEKGIVSPWPQAGLRLVWHKSVGVGYGMPSIRGDKLYQFDRHGNLARLSCLDRRTGEFHWKFEYPSDYQDIFGYDNGPRCCPIVDEDRVYIFGAEGMLHCVNAADGKLIWKVDTRAEFNVIQNFFGVGSAPVVEGDLLILQVGGSPKGSDGADFGDLKGNGSGVVAFDKRTGKVKYQVTDELAGYAGPVLATIHGRRWCFVFARGGLIGLEPSSGKVDFHYPWRARVLESVNASNPVVAGERVFISETYGAGSSLLKVRPGGYEVLWSDGERARNQRMQCHWNTPIHHAGHVYGSSGRYPNIAELRCLELDSGEVKWRKPGLSLTSLLMVDGHFICLSEDGELRLLKVNPAKYEEVSRMEVVDRKGNALLHYPCWAAPILAHGLLYLRGKERLVCLELIPSTDR